ncbi:MAG: murein biosynthesis integral membrane protein MurJ [Xanthobacteraceae bacterium]
MSLARDVTSVGSATLVSRLLGFFRDIGIAAVLGAGPLSDAYFAALQIPNLFRRLLAEGALNAAFVPIWMRIRDQGGDTRAFAQNVFGLMLLGLGAFAILCALFAPLVVHALAPGFDSTGERFAGAVAFLRLSVPYVAMAGMVAVAAAILNAQGRVATAAFSIVVFNAILLAALVVVLVLHAGASRLAGDILSSSIVVAGIVQFVLVAAALRGSPDCPQRPSVTLSPAVRRFFAGALPGVVASGAPQLKLMVGAMVASPSQAAVSWLYYANRLYELPLGVVSVAVASVLGPRIAASVLAGERSVLAAAQSRAFEIALGLALPSAVAFVTLADPIAGGLFERGAFGASDTAAVAAALAAMSAGLPGHVLEKVLGAVSFGHQDTRTPMWAAVAGLASATVLALVLFPLYAQVGVAAAIAVSGWVGASILAVLLWRRRWLALDQLAGRRVPAILLATAAMGVAIVGTDAFVAMIFDVAGSSLSRLASLAGLVILGLTVYLLALQVLGVVRIRELIAAVR